MGISKPYLELGIFRSTVCQVQRFQENDGPNGSSQKLGQNELQVTYGIHVSNAMTWNAWMSGFWHTETETETFGGKKQIQVAQIGFLKLWKLHLHLVVFRKVMEMLKIQGPFYDGFFSTVGAHVGFWVAALFDGNSSRDTLHYGVPPGSKLHLLHFTWLKKSSLLVKDELRSWWNQHCPVLHLWNLWICNFCSHTKWWSWMKLDALHHPLMVNVMSSTSS